MGQSVNVVPEPHPLDFDWRFDSKTVIELSNLISNGEPILVIGCPTLAQHLHRTGNESVLVDRQPFQCVETQIELDLNVGGCPIYGFNTAVVDPPWYPEQLSSWIAWAANCVGVGGTIYASIWPEKTRPSGEREYIAAREWMESWSSVVQLGYLPTYEMPLFETIAQGVSRHGTLARSPRVGRLLRINVQVVPTQPLTPYGRESWLRFVLNNYQLAVRLRADTSISPSINTISGADGWTWPFVSRRAPQRSQIDIWSSQNEVAEANGLNVLIETIRRLSQTQDDLTFEATLSPFPGLRQWNIPRPPYWRIYEWSHHQ